MIKTENVDNAVMDIMFKKDYAFKMMKIVENMVGSIFKAISFYLGVKEDIKSANIVKMTSILIFNRYADLYHVIAKKLYQMVPVFAAKKDINSVKENVLKKL